MKEYCPNCGVLEDVILIEGKEFVIVRSEKIEVNAKYLKCLACDEEFNSPTIKERSLREAYVEYRRRHSMVQPGEIKAFREKYGLTQHEFSALIGFGSITLSRYENGAMQDGAHDKALRLAMEPRNLLVLLKHETKAISEEKRKRLIDELENQTKISNSIERILEELLNNYEPNIFSGYQRMDFNKFINAILFFCQNGKYKTVLNKLLFYLDFKYFKENSISVTGSRYIHMQYGPVPDRYEYIFAYLIYNGYLRHEEVPVGQYIGERLSSKKSYDISLFSSNEKKILNHVMNYFSHFGSKRIHDFSSKEKAYTETPEEQFISYKFAENLQI